MSAGKLVELLGGLGWDAKVAAEAVVPVIGNDEIDLEVIAEAYTAGQAALRELGDVVDALKGELIRRSPRPTVAGRFAIEVKRPASRRKWNDDRLLALVSRQRIEEMAEAGDGELPSVGEAVDQVLATIAECAAIGYWRVKELRDRSIDPDAYCEVALGSPQLSVSELAVTEAAADEW